MPSEVRDRFKALPNRPIIASAIPISLTEREAPHVLGDGVVDEPDASTRVKLAVRDEPDRHVERRTTLLARVPGSRDAKKTTIIVVTT